jgi:hypothetical protein
VETGRRSQKELCSENSLKVAVALAPSDLHECVAIPAIAPDRSRQFGSASDTLATDWTAYIGLLYPDDISIAVPSSVSPEPVLIGFASAAGMARVAAAGVSDNAPPTYEPLRSVQGLNRSAMKGRLRAALPAEDCNL